MDKSTLVTRFREITSQRESLINLLEQPSIGILRIDVNQALEEMDELIEEFEKIFPEEKIY